MAKKSDKIAEQLRKRPVKEKTSRELLSLGSTVVNLACSGKITGAIPKGTVLHLPGDSDSGKTFFAMSVFGEAAKNPAFDDHDFLFFNAEDGALMDRIRYFGKKAAGRIIESVPETLEEFYYKLDDQIMTGRPFVAVLDSMDVLYPKAWLKKMKAAKNATKKGEDASGDYGTQKAKINSENLRKVRSAVRKSGSILVIISQAKDDVGSFRPSKVAAGGRTLKFYCTIQIWTSTKETIYKNILGKPRAIGIKSKIEVKKNHLNGNKRTVFVPILNDSGIDEVGACVDFLVEEGYWKTKGEKGKGKIFAEEFDPRSDDKPWKGMSREKLIQLIEENDNERELRGLVKQVWEEIDDGCKSNRKPRYE